MSSGLLGMDVDGARSLAATLTTWPRLIDDVIVLVADAEFLADLPTGASTMLDQIGADASTMATAIRRAADALESFTIGLASPRSIALAVADVKAFAGSDNDPELDRRLRVLRGLVEVDTASDDEAAMVMAALLAADRSVHIAHRDLTDVRAALAEVDELTQAAVDGAVSDNDPRIDQAVARLRAAVDPHSSSDRETDRLLALLLDPDRSADPATLIAAETTGHSIEVVRVAHHLEIDYDVADGVVKMAEVDRLTAAVTGALSSASLGGVDSLLEQRRALLVDLVGGDDPLVLASLGEMLNDGATAIEAFESLDDHVAAELRRREVDAIALALGVDDRTAEATLDDMRATTLELAEAGFDIDDAAEATAIANHAGLDISAVRATALEEHLTLVEASAVVFEAGMYALTVAELRALQGLDEHFGDFDRAVDGKEDGIVSLADLEFVVANRDPSDKVAIIAAALIASPALRHRLDRGRDHNTDIVGEAPFGATVADDNKFSRDDLAFFHQKQAINFLLQDQLEAIDVAAQGGDPRLIDHRYSEADFEATLVRADELGLSDQQIAAIETVLAADWYDKTYWQEHGDSYLMAAAAVAGGAIFLASMGTGTGISAMLIASAQATLGGSLVASGLTIGENLLTGDDWDEDLDENMVLGATAGLGGAGLAGAPSGFAAEALSVRVVTALGFSADTAGLAALGTFDPLLTPMLDDAELEDFKETASTAGYGLGALSVVGAAASAGGAGFAADRVGGSAPDVAPSYANFGGETFDDGLAGMASRLELTPIEAARVQAAAAVAADDAIETARLVGLADDLLTASAVGVGQRATGLGLDLVDTVDTGDEVRPAGPGGES